ncbi:TerD family protein [Yinghuangia sp. YIM S09857]|uniref:TerD family protein n=1 Tax=Yinghuangia sp. YIM S09857 TaxID=3436929 RepID=UPI003F530A85
MRELRKGENTPVADAGQLVSMLAGVDEEPGVRPGLSALVLHDDRAAAEQELLSRDAPVGAEGAVCCVLRGDTVVSVSVHPGRLSGDVERILVVGSLDDGTMLAAATGLRLTVADASGGLIAGTAVDVAGGESAVVLAELYRNKGAWKLRAISQGYASGLAGLLRDRGVSTEPSTGNPIPQNSARVVSLLKHHELDAAPIRVTLVIHHWPELEPLFEQGVIREMVDRVSALARV